MKQFVLAFFITAITTAATAQIQSGNQAPEISLPNANDSIINLSSLKGKVVLVDFWASWCGPCRKSIPSVVRLYNKYKDNGFEVLGVSLDEKKSEWLKAVKYFRMKYTLINDIAAWNSKVAAAYQVEAIPASFLLDRDGKIIMVDEEGKKLENKIKELLQQPFAGKTE
ncbi:MAG: TlpA disulfide reductase family protein [Ferruginibacter sp.]